MSLSIKQVKQKVFAYRIKSPLWAIASSILLVAAILVVLIHYGVHEQVLQLLKWFEAQGAWAPLLFILIMALVVVLLLPGVLLTTGAGFVFGVMEGSIVVVLGTILGASLAFLMARYLFGKRATQFVLRHAKVRLVGEELSPHGWKIVLLTRLIPFFPSKISNYFFGLTSFSFRGYVGGSLIGFIPFSVHSVYLGSIAADVATLGQHHLGRTPLEWAIYGLGFLATLIAVLYLNRLARQALARYMRESPDEEVT
ncbi:MAG: TVP38/TMEM64 family protein [Desulfuromonadales bacterium]|nr:TVP38/TMEM64 family protein [Desulfuromonadales bacterium]